MASVVAASALLMAVPGTSCRADQVDDIIAQEMVAQHIPGVALAVIRDGKIERFGGYGVANLEKRTPITATTVFAIASISKQFLAAGIMVLVQDGMLSLDETVERFLPDAPVEWHPITIRHLLNHTSGLARDVPGEDRFGTQAPLDAIRAAYSVPLSFRPGEQWQYSNVGYYVIAEILTSASGEPWFKFIAHRIMDPLGMDATRTTNLTVPHRATGYEWDGTKLTPAREWGFRPSGAYVSSAHDLAKWDAALYREQPLSAATRTAMWTAAPVTVQPSFGYAFGWQTATRGGKYVTYHGGGRSGFKAYFARFPGEHLSFVVLTNAGHADPEPILWKVAAIWLPGVNSEQ
jgi:D-alanyl-D-alanine carboxypeptidase